MLVADLITDASFEFGDAIVYDGSYTITTDGSRITGARWLKFLQDAIRTLILSRPDANAVTESHLLTGLATRQSLPSDSLRLIEITRNMGSDGLTPGYPITIINRSELDDSNFSWHSEAASSGGSAFIDHFTYNLKDPYHFFVTPAPSTSPAVYVEIVTSKLPSLPTAGSDTVPVTDVFWQPLLHWMLYKAFAIDDEAVNVELAIHHHNGFYQSIGQEVQAGTIVKPSVKE